MLNTDIIQSASTGKVLQQFHFRNPIFPEELRAVLNNFARTKKVLDFTMVTNSAFVKPWNKTYKPNLRQLTHHQLYFKGALCTLYRLTQRVDLEKPNKIYKHNLPSN